MNGTTTRWSLGWILALIGVLGAWHLIDPLGSPSKPDSSATHSGAKESAVNRAGARPGGSAATGPEAQRGALERSSPGLSRAHISSHNGTSASATPFPSKPLVKSGNEPGEKGQRANGTANDPNNPRRAPSLSGRVLDGDGNPLVGIAVQARVERLVDPLTPPGRAEGSASTGANGEYAFSGLADGQYRVSAEATGYARAEITARTGTEDADLMLHWEKTIQVYGRLTSRGGEPLEGARVTPNLSPAVSVPTDAAGNYEVVVNLRENVSHFDVRFEHAQHVPQTRRLDEASWEPTGSVALSVALEPITRTTRVLGRLQSTSGEPVAGETVILYSPSLMQRFEAVSGQDGGFRIAEVSIAPDYLVSVRPRGPYEDFTRREVRVTAPTELPILLEPMQSGDLVGRMTDVYGTPVPSFTLMLHSTSAAGRTLTVTGNERGEFAVADVPFGALVFQTHAFPFFRITNLVLGPDTQEVSIVLDWGSYEVRGRVLDEAGFPLAAPEVYLTWSHTQGRVSSSAMRRTAADADGYFRFARLGVGLHRVTVNVPGYRPGQVDHNVGGRSGEILLQLQPEVR